MENIIDEHKKIINSIKLLNKSSESLYSILETTGIAYSEHSQILQWINHQLLLLDDAFKHLLRNNSYGTVFTNVRSVFEKYWILNLCMNGCLYYKYFKTRNKGIATRLCARWKGDLHNFHANNQHKNILTVFQKGQTIRVSYKGSYDSRGKLFPFYFFLFQQYNPLKAYLGKEPKLIENYLLSSKFINETHVNQKTIHTKYFSFSKGVYDSLLLNKMINKKKWQRINVHYNFLSMWVHPNINSIKLIDKNHVGSTVSYKLLNKKYDFYLTRLALLYIGNMHILFQKAFIKYSNRQRKEGKLANVNSKLVEKRIKNFELLTDYFWFLDNKPHLAYKFKYCINRLYKNNTTRRNLQLLMPTQVSNSQVPYYENPYEILKDIHGGRRNRILGIIQDPFKNK